MKSSLTRALFGTISTSSRLTLKTLQKHRTIDSAISPNLIAACDLCHNRYSMERRYVGTFADVYGSPSPLLFNCLLLRCASSSRSWKLLATLCHGSMSVSVSLVFKSEGAAVLLCMLRSLGIPLLSSFISFYTSLLNHFSRMLAPQQSYPSTLSSS